MKTILLAALLFWSAAPAFPALEDTASPAAERMAAAQKQLAADPKRFQAENELALACIRRARETDDPAYLRRAEAALAAGIALAPDDFQLARTGVALLLAEHRYGDAQSRASALHRQNPDDVTVYSYQAEAGLALGDYEAADAATQWMLNMRPNNTPGLLLGAELRVVYGDAAGALDFLNQAFGETPPIEPEELAMIANRIAALELASGQTALAAQAIARAQELFPHYRATQINLARLHLQQQKPSEALAVLDAELAVEQQQHTATAEVLFLRAQALAAGGQGTAPSAFARFAAQTTADRAAQTTHGDNSSTDAAGLDLILLKAGLPGGPPPEAAAALRLAEARVATRHDVATLDAYAWALYANARYADADAQMEKTLAPGVRDAQYFAHAGSIALKRDQAERAAGYFASARGTNSASAYAGAGHAIADEQPLPKSEPTPPFAAPVPVAVSTQMLTPLNESHDAGSLPTGLLIPKPTGTERAIRKMQAQVNARPQDAKAYTGLGAAFFQRARETGDVEDYQLAEQALHKSLDMESVDLSATAALETMAEVCMGEHRFDDALEYAQKALALGSGDLSAFALVGDAYADMGSYEKAGVAYARLSSSVPGAAAADRQGYAQQTRAAYLKFVAGNTAGAVAEMQAAIAEGLQAQLPSENLAWLYFELGEFEYQAGHVQAAADAYLTALTVYPGDYRALAGLGKVRANQGAYTQAITLYQSAINVVPMPAFVSDLGDLYAKTGNTGEAEKQYKLVVYIGLLGHINQVLHNRDLALFYADHDIKLPESLALAQKEFEVRSDIYTWDALAWSLYKNGRYPEADDAMQHAARLGTRDAMLLFHAGMIAAKLNRTTEAAQQLTAALALNPHFHVLDAALAAETLRALHPSAVAAATQHAMVSRHAQ